MRQIITGLGILFICGNCFAEMYSVDRDDGGVSIIHYKEGSRDSLDDVIKELGFEGMFIRRITEIPNDRSDREFWAMSGKKIVIDNVKKQASINEKLNERMKRDAVLNKLKLSEDEAKSLKGAVNAI